MVNFDFIADENYGKTLVFCENEVECLRIRYSKLECKKNYSVESKALPHIPFMFGRQNSFLSFFGTMYKNITLCSCKGPNAIRFNVTKSINAFSFVTNDNFKNAIVIIGSVEHCYMLRFSFRKDIFYLSDVYEICNILAKDIVYQKKIPHSSEWGLCEVCCKKTTLHCKQCKVMYCSKLCQKVDWKNHKTYCTECF
tara:strand:- start:13 stop:600 length:588 start_codon:yes stop_codon:yes gene_type:complete